ncbi:MAG: TMEM175 family protein [Marinoscillum sp.]|uniref:TMEM175 family protein n=1 Tax=Marinoscillum sp. TaxID=2024838 RepID=UPI0032F6FA9C
MRKLMKDQEVGLDPYFRYRGKNQTRVEAFTDAAFALGITLIVLSTSAPNTFDELWLSMRDVIPFGLCVILVMVIWYQHYLFFLRYGLQDSRIITLNTFLIFLILIYVYPLKFLFKVLFDIYVALFTSDKEIFQHLFTSVIRMEDTRTLMVLYGMGGALIFFTISLMYHHALKISTELELDEYEIHETKTALQTNVLMGMIPLLSTLVALSGLFGMHNFAVSGFIYMLYPPVMIIHERISKKRRNQLLTRLNLKSD